MQAAETIRPAAAEPRRITWAFEFEQELEIFASGRCLAKCPGCAHGACSSDEGHSGRHECNDCGTTF